MPSHELIDFVNSATRQMEESYIKIQKRAREDPGTAGDQGEEDWAKLLRGWLPPTFQIVTKGRILSEKGIASPQIDILILQPEYPKNFLSEKLYFAGGVIAAFECKVTLKAKHIEEFFKNSIEIKKHISEEKGTLQKELQTNIIYGLLAHSHYWKNPNSDPIESLKRKIEFEEGSQIKHPIYSPDIICVADLACFSATKIIHLDSLYNSQAEISVSQLKLVISAGYMEYSKRKTNQKVGFTPIGSLISLLFFKLSYNYPSLRTLSSYFESVLLSVSSEGTLKDWDLTTLSLDLRKKIELEKFKYAFLEIK